MNIKLTKNINEANCITHAGTFHADEVFATIILSKVMDDITLIRLPEIKEEVSGKMIYDIGGGKYDHHQFGGNGQRENGVKYAACGLIWKEFGRKVLENIQGIDVDFVWDMIDKNLIQFIDSNDNGQLPRLEVDYKNVHLASIIGQMNPFWNEEVDADDRFMEALKIAEVIFDRTVISMVSKYRAKDIVDKAIAESENNILFIDVYVPWKDFLNDSQDPKAKDILFAVFPSNRGGYSIYTIPVEKDSFESRKLLPSAWAGLRDEELQKVTGVKTARFCHNARFICTCDTLEDARILAQMALENEE